MNFRSIDTLLLPSSEATGSDNHDLLSLYIFTQCQAFADMVICVETGIAGALAVMQSE